MRYRSAHPRWSAPIPVHFHRPSSRFAIAFAAATQSNRQASIALDALCQLLPTPPRFILSDNGSEFMGEFQQRLEHDSITSLVDLPKIAQNERPCRTLDRTIQEQFVDYHEDELFYDLAGFNRKLANWLLDDNTLLPCHSLGLQSPATSSSTINQSAKGGGLIQMLDKRKIP